MVLRHMKQKKKVSLLARCIAKLTHGMQTAINFRPTVDGGGFPGWITWNETTCEMALELSGLPTSGNFRIQLINFDDFIVFETPLLISNGQICAAADATVQDLDDDVDEGKESFMPKTAAPNNSGDVLEGARAGGNTLEAPLLGQPVSPSSGRPQDATLRAPKHRLGCIDLEMI
jgi:hypothetical protein